MKIIGIDPGIGRMGYAVIERRRGEETLMESGLIETLNGRPKEARLLEIYNKLSDVLKRTTPKIAGVESLFFAKNAKTAIAVAEARGVALLALRQQGVDIREVTPLEVKVALTGYGRAGKQQVGIMVQKILRLHDPIKQDDIADAAAVAISVLNMQTIS